MKRYTLARCVVFVAVLLACGCADSAKQAEPRAVNVREDPRLQAPTAPVTASTSRNTVGVDLAHR